MTLREIKGFLDKISYKDGYKLSLLDDPPYGVLIKLTVVTKDSDTSGASKTSITASSYVPYDVLDRMSVVDFIMYVRKIIIDFEDHDRKEWFKVDGKVVEEPHPEEYADTRTWKPKEKV